MEVRTVDQIADTNDPAESVVGETLEMIDEILAGKVFLGHRAVPVVLESDVAVKINLRGHHGFAGQVDMSCAGRNLDLAFAADSSEETVFNDECGVLDRS